MQRQSPPKHRHDGTSPLPLGMDWSPPPRRWNGQETIWPHDPRTGWSYCIMIPSWVVRPKSRDSDPVVFYRVQIGLQSPDGITTSRGVLRRFNDFLKLFTVLRKAFPKKSLPPAPPKGLLRMKSRTLLEERRCSLEEWMGKLLSDLDISRSVAVASFLELEAAARTSFLEENMGSAEATHSPSSTASKVQAHPNSSPPLISGSESLMSDYGSDTAYEASEIGTSSLGRDNSSEVGMEDFSLDDDLTNPVEKFVKYGMSNIDEGLSMGHAILEQLEGFPRHKVLAREINTILENSTSNGNATKSIYNGGDASGLLSEQEHSKAINHSRKLSNESVGSELRSIRGSEMSIGGFLNSFGDGSLDPPGGAEVSKTTEILGNTELQFSGDAQLILPLDHRQQMHRVLMTMQRRLVTAKTDMEDLISRLNQETAVKDYLTTKVKDLEVELESTTQKSKENLQQAILIEKERFTQMQWDMEEFRRKSLEMELKLKSLQDGEVDSEPKTISHIQEKDAILQELDNNTKQQLEDLLKRQQELESKSKADIKVLVKEVKSLRSSQAELKLQLNQSLKEKSEAERILEQQKQKQDNAKTARRKLLHECKILLGHLQECNIKLLEENTQKLFMDSASLPEALDLLTTSDNQIDILLREAQLLAQDDGYVDSGIDGSDCTGDDDEFNIEVELRQMLTDIFTDNARLRKLVNSIFWSARKLGISSEKDGNESSSKQVLQNKAIER